MFVAKYIEVLRIMCSLASKMFYGVVCTSHLNSFGSRRLREGGSWVPISFAKRCFENKALPPIRHKVSEGLYARSKIILFTKSGIIFSARVCQSS